MSVFPAFMSVYNVCAEHVKAIKKKRGIKSSGCGVMGVCKLPRGCWEWNLGPLQGLQGLLAFEPSLQPLSCHLWNIHHVLGILLGALDTGRLERKSQWSGQVCKSTL